MQKIVVATAIGFFFAACGEALAQQAPVEKFYLRNLEKTDLIVTITGNDERGNPKSKTHTFAAGQKMWVLLGPNGAGYEPFEFDIKEHDGTVTKLRQVHCCSHMANCKRLGVGELGLKIPAFVIHTVGGSEERIFDAVIAWEHFSIDFNRK